MTTKRTTHRSTAGTKLLAKRKSGQFTDIQTHRRSSRADQRITTVAEAMARLLFDARAFAAIFDQACWDKDTRKGAIYKLCASVKRVDKATRAAAARKRARSVKP